MKLPEVFSFMRKRIFSQVLHFVTAVIVIILVIIIHLTTYHQ